MYKQTDVTKDPVDVVLDPNEFSVDGSIALDTFASSPDGRLFAYGTTKGGAQWNTVKIRNVETLKDYEDDILHYVRYSSISWMHDNEGFFYSVHITNPLELEAHLKIVKLI